MATKRPTTTEVKVRYLANILGDQAPEITIPVGTMTVQVPGRGGNGGGWAVFDTDWLAKVTGNTHDPKYRWCLLPDEAFAAPAPAKAKVYPNQTFERAARDAGAWVHVLWEQPGPKDTVVAWNVAYNVNGGPVIVQTYTDSSWVVFTSFDTRDQKESIADALARCGVTVPKAEG
jgi:hypothetical protein